MIRLDYHLVLKLDTYLLLVNLRVVNEGRATDPIWSIQVYDLSRSVVSYNQPVLYYLLDGPRRGFVREELQFVPDDTELPPNFVLQR